MQKSQKKNLWIGIIVGAVISVLTLGMLFIVFVMLFYFGGPAEVTTDISVYEESIGQG